MLQVLAVIHVLLSAALISLILMHSGRDAGLGGMGFTPASRPECIRISEIKAAERSTWMTASTWSIAPQGSSGPDA